MKRSKNGSTVKQYAYATRRLSGKGSSKKEMALLSGFSMSVAENVKNKVEDTEGYQNAIIGLANESGNLLAAILAEFKARGLSKFNNADLVKALNAISGAWEKIENRGRAPNKLLTPEGNRLRAVLTQRTVTQTAVVEAVPEEPIHLEATPVATSSPEPATAEDMDF